MIDAKRASSKRDKQQQRKKFYQAVDQGELTLRDAVRQFRIMTGKNQKDFAKFVGVSLRTLVEFEQGHGKWNPSRS